jgi:hypothetical protein
MDDFPNICLPLSPVRSKRQTFPVSTPEVKVEEKRYNFSLRKLRKPGERAREKCFAPLFEIFHTKREKTFL